MRPLLLAASICACALPALAQEGRFVDPQPVDFDQPFQFDGLRVRDGAPPQPRSVGIPIEQWLANGRKVEGLRQAAPPNRTLDALDGKALQELFQNLLPVETPMEKAPPSPR